MLILDSNLWIHALTVGGGYPDECIERFRNERELSAVSAYIFSEVAQNIDSDTTIESETRDDAIQRFSALLYNCRAIRSCPQAEIRDMDLEAERAESYNKAIGDLAKIQPKDVPIFTLAYQTKDQQPTVCTDDESFAEFSPSEYGLDEISIEHVSVSWDRVEQPAE
ncbi:hypothetical protein [Natrinema versiforme]|uniref:PIN domain-containing protein n=1 Tax=Natrinema versiforme TaxID=88724 RepID=A0A4P8WGB6_9EURY|nr:hypothetical protein [Natrinema versiforme]QCS42134.1 hypothetical protein FEJ81_07095 [Natrinema versiforme]